MLLFWSIESLAAVLIMCALDMARKRRANGGGGKYVFCEVIYCVAEQKSGLSWRLRYEGVRKEEFLKNISHAYHNAFWVPINRVGISKNK